MAETRVREPYDNERPAETIIEILLEPHEIETIETTDHLVIEDPTDDGILLFHPVTAEYGHIGVDDHERITGIMDSSSIPGRLGRGHVVSFASAHQDGRGTHKGTTVRVATVEMKGNDLRSDARW